MRTYTNLYEGLCSYDNLERAFTKARKSRWYKEKENELTINATSALKYFLAAILLILVFKVAVNTYPNFFSTNMINLSQPQPTTSLVSNIASILYHFATLAALVLIPILGLMLFLIGIIPLFKMLDNLKDLKLNKI